MLFMTNEAYYALQTQKEEKSRKIFESISASLYYEKGWIVELPDGRKTSFYTIDEVFMFARELKSSIEKEVQKLKFNALINSDEEITKKLLSKFN